ncbi:MAG: DnaJ domain-containing protein [Candidatus Limnocylindrales bacterium]
MPRRLDPYAVLGVAPTATQGELQRAFRRLSRAHHPDANPDDTKAEPAFKRLARAWELVRTPTRRRAYDARRALGRFAVSEPGRTASFEVADGQLYHSDLGHHSDFYQSGDPLTVREAAGLVGRDPAWLRRAIRARRLPATRTDRGYLLRRRDVERLDRAGRVDTIQTPMGTIPGTDPSGGPS